MDESPQLQQITPEHAASRAAADEEIGRRKRFWLWMICISAACMILLPVSALLISAYRMSKVFAASGGAPAGVDQLSLHINEAMITHAIGLLSGVLGLLSLIISLIRFFTLPRRSSLMQRPVDG